MTKTIDALCTAYDLLASRGWTQDQYIDENGCLCVLAAVRLAVGYREDDRLGNGWSLPAEIGDDEYEEIEEQENELKKAMVVSAGYVWPDIDEYDLEAPLSLDAINDQVAESQDEVTAWLEACIIAEAQSIAA